MAVSVDQFVRHLLESGLMPDDELAAFCRTLPQQPETVEELARALIQAGKLTKYQAAAIYQGKTTGLVLGNYVILDQLGEGGMGQVFKARHTRMDRLVALKVLSPRVSKDAGAVKRFLREVKAAAKLSHPNIVASYDADEAGGTHFLVMEHVAGKDLAQFVRQVGPLPPRQAMECLLQAARGLSYAHGEGVIHRDIKPSNLLLDEKGRVKVLDMGLARLDTVDPNAATGEDLTETGSVMGTIDYMAPEQATDSKTADARSDIYSLGCTLHYLLTARPPYQADTMVSRVLAHREQPIPSLVEARPDVTAELDAIFQKMLAKEQLLRYQSMQEVVADLESIAGTSGPSTGMAASATPAEDDSQLLNFLAGLSQQPAATLTEKKTNQAAETMADVSVDATVSQQPALVTTTTAPRAARRSSRGLFIAGTCTAVALAIGVIVMLTGGDNEPTDDPGENAKVTTPQNGTTNRNTTTSPTSPSNYALAFDGIDDYVDVPSLQYKGGHPLTIEARIRIADETKSNQPIVTPGSYPLLQTSAIKGRADDSQFYIREWDVPLVPGTDINLAGVYDGKTLRLFVNGRQTSKPLEVVTKNSRKETTKRLDFGGRHTGEAAKLGSQSPTNRVKEFRHFFKGTIDEVRISNTARYDKNYTPAKRFTPDEHTLALYHFDEGDGTELLDSSGNNHHGTIVGANWVNADGTPTDSARQKAIDLIYQHGGTLAVVNEREGEERQVTRTGDINGDEWNWLQLNLRDADSLSATELQQILAAIHNPYSVYLPKLGNTAELLPVVLASVKSIDESSAIDGDNIRALGQRLSGILSLGLPCDAEDFHLAKLAEFRWLDQLLCSSCTQLTDAGLRNLIEHPNARRFRVLLTSSTQLTDKSVTDFVAVARNIGVLNLGTTGITDACLPTLGKLSDLRNLHARNTSVTDNGLAALDECSLVLLNVAGTNVTQAGITRFRSKHPDCTIIWDGGTLEPGEFPANYALQFDGKDDHVEVPTFNYDGSHPITLEATVRIEKVLDNIGQIVCLPEFLLARNTQYFFCRTRPDEESTYVIRAEGHFDPVQQYHVAAVYNGSTIDLYVNGVRQTKGRRSDSKDNEISPEQQQNISLQDLHKRVGLYIGATNPLTNYPNGRDHFNGIIDELRISKTARYTKDFKPETRFQPDEHTLALYHFDEGKGSELRDASGNNHHGKITGAKWVRVDETLNVVAAPPAKNYALQFDGETSVDIPSYRYDGSHPVTIETWVVPDSATDWTRPIIATGGPLHLVQLKDWSASVVVTRSEKYLTVGGEKPTSQKLTHLAVVYDGEQVSLFVDGVSQPAFLHKSGDKLDTYDAPLKIKLKDFPFSTRTLVGSSFFGEIDECRISRIARYKESFNPARRFQPDQHTIALYHFDEGEGDQLKDASGNNHHGKIHGAKWVPSPLADSDTAALFPAGPPGEVKRLLLNRASALALRFATNGKSLFTIGRKEGVESIDQWDLQAGQILRRFETTSLHAPDRSTIDVSPDGRFLAGPGEDWKVRVWNIATGVLVHEFSLGDKPASKEESLIEFVRFSPDSARLVAARSNRAMYVFDINAKRQIHIYEADSHINDAVFNTVDSRQVVATWGTALRSWNPETNDVQARKLTGGNAIAMAANAPLIGVAKRSNEVKDGFSIIVKYDSTDEPITLDNDKSVFDIALTPNGRFAVTTLQTGEARVWDVVARKVIYEFTPEIGTAVGVDLSPDGRLAATSYFDDKSSVRIWRLPAIVREQGGY